MMQLKEVKSEGLVKHFRGLVPIEILQKAKDDYLQEMGKSRKVPGFRPGKIPAAVLEKKYGQEAHEYVLSKHVEKSAQDALAANKIRPAIRPQIEILSEDVRKGVEFEVKVEVYPTITMPDFAKLSFQRYTAELSEKSIDDSLARLADQYATVEPDGAAKKVAENHAVIADLAFDISGIKDGASAQQNVTLELGQNKVLPDIEKNVIGAKIGDVVKVSTTFPSHADAKIANKDVVYEVTVKEIKKRVPHEINDDLAVKVKLDGLDALKVAIRERLQSDLDGHARSLMKREMFDALNALVSFDLPPSLVNEEADSIRQNLKSDETGTLTKDQEKEVIEVAERRVKLGLLFNQIADDNKIDVPVEKVQEALMARVNANPAHAKQILDYYKDTPGAIDEIRGPLLENQVVDHIVDQSHPKEKKLSEKEIFAKLNS